MNGKINSFSIYLHLNQYNLLQPGTRFCLQRNYAIYSRKSAQYLVILDSSWFVKFELKNNAFATIYYL